MLGIDGYVVRVEADSSVGTPGFAIIGLPDRALGEAKDRVRAAIVNAGYRFPAGRVLVNLAPAELKKSVPASISRSPSRCSPSTNKSTRSPFSASSYSASSRSTAPCGRRAARSP